MTNVYRNENEYSQFDNGGENITEYVNRLLGKPTGKQRLPPAPQRAAIPVSKSTALPTSTQPNTGGVVSPLVEQAYAGTTYYNVVSSDGFIVFEYGHETEYIDDGGSGSTLTFQHLDMTPP